ncbi:MAG: hypothetical protein V4724_22880 [Pseudomonadota bacterium]
MHPVPGIAAKPALYPILLVAAIAVIGLGGLGAAAIAGWLPPSVAKKPAPARPDIQRADNAVGTIGNGRAFRSHPPLPLPPA